MFGTKGGTPGNVSRRPINILNEEDESDQDDIFDPLTVDTQKKSGRVYIFNVGFTLYSIGTDETNKRFVFKRRHPSDFSSIFSRS
jgi:hypothetical protein